MRTSMRLVAATVAVLALVGTACRDAVKVEFEAARAANTEQAYRQFLEAHPDHVLAPDARIALESVVLDSALRAGSVEALESFITEFPASQRVAEAQSRLEVLALEVARQTATIEAYESLLGRYPDGSQSGVARAELDVLVRERIYRWRPTGVLRAEGADDIEVTETKDHSMEIRATSDSSHVPATMDLSGGSFQFFVEGLGSRNVKVKVNKALGFTTYAGLRFKEDLTLSVREDGAIAVDREGVEALNSEDQRLVSRKVDLNGETVIVMVVL